MLYKKESLPFIAGKGDEFKLEIFRNIKDGDITFYTQGNFIDLCKGTSHSIFRKNTKQLNY